MTGRLQDMVCLITGAAEGIGAAYARVAAEGAAIAIVDLTRIDQAADVEADIAAMGGRSLAIKADVTDADQMQEVGRRVVDELGRIDCLVNNAALMFDQLTASWEDFLAVNFMGAITRPTRSSVHVGAAPRIHREHLVDRGLPVAASRDLQARGRRAGSDDRPEGYGMTKWMLIRQTRVMAQMLGSRGIRVNAVCPGVTMSPATKAVVPPQIIEELVQSSILGTTLEPEDMTGLILYLASNESSKMTGQVLINDAGCWFTS